jgi:hypothetical protein
MGKEYDGIHRTTFVDENGSIEEFQMLKQRRMLRKF